MDAANLDEGLPKPAPDTAPDAKRKLAAFDKSVLILLLLMFSLIPVLGYFAGLGLAVCLIGLWKARSRFWYAVTALFLLRCIMLVYMEVITHSDRHPANVKAFYRHVGPMMFMLLPEPGRIEINIWNQIKGNKASMAEELAAMRSHNGEYRELPRDIYSPAGEAVKFDQTAGRFYSLGPNRIDDLGLSYDPTNGVGSGGDLILN